MQLAILQFIILNEVISILINEILQTNYTLKKIMNKILIESAILSAENLISNKLEPLIEDDLQSEIEIVLAQLELALKELNKEVGVDK